MHQLQDVSVVLHQNGAFIQESFVLSFPLDFFSLFGVTSTFAKKITLNCLQQ